MEILLIVAAGKSSRFGGFPKAFCDIGGRMNVENTIYMAHKYYDRIYLGVNQKIYNEYKNKIKNCEMFSIVTGQGDAHSLLKCLKKIEISDKENTNVTICWGDAVFLNEVPFKRLIESSGEKVQVACSADENPYAWFDTIGDKISKAHFMKADGAVACGMHDQSIFRMNMGFAIDYLDQYRVSLGIPENNDETKTDVNEMKLLYSFEYLYNEMNSPACVVEIDKGNVLAFNTQEELVSIRRILEKRKNNNV